jgi:phage FluMu protein Com
VAIQFHCTQCGKLLQTGDQTAGKQARCPECGGLMTIPAGPQAPAPADSGNPFQSPGPVAPASPVQPPGAITPTALDLADIFGRTWSIFQRQWGMCLVVLLIVLAITLTLNFAVSAGTRLTSALTGDRDSSTTFSVLGNLASWMIGIWLGIGQSVYFLKTARGQVADISDVFAGGPYFWRILRAVILLVLMIGGVLFVCTLPLQWVGGMNIQDASPGLVVLGAIVAFAVYVYVMLMLSQFYYLILDRNVGVMDSFHLSQRLMRGNKLRLFLIWLVAILVGGLLALLTCGLGILAVMPFFSLMSPVIYLVITGQPTAGGLPNGHQ